MIIPQFCDSFLLFSVYISGTIKTSLGMMESSQLSWGDSAAALILREGLSVGGSYVHVQNAQREFGEVISRHQGHF